MMARGDQVLAVASPPPVGGNRDRSDSKMTKLQKTSGKRRLHALTAAAAIVSGCMVIMSVFVLPHSQYPSYTTIGQHVLGQTHPPGQGGTDGALPLSDAAYISNSWTRLASLPAVTWATLTGRRALLAHRIAAAQNVTACASPCVRQREKLPAFSWSSPLTWLVHGGLLLRKLWWLSVVVTSDTCIPSRERLATIAANEAYFKEQVGSGGVRKQFPQVTLYKLYHMDVSNKRELYGFDWGKAHNNGFPFGGRNSIPFEPPVRGVRQRGPPKMRRYLSHLDMSDLYPPGRDDWLQIQLSEFSGMLGIANAMEDPQACVFGAAGGAGVQQTSHSLHWTPWIGFTSWKDVKSARIDWNEVIGVDRGNDANTVYAFFNLLPECNPHSHRPSSDYCASEHGCHGGAICFPDLHLDTSFPGMRGYIADLWQRTFGASLPALPPSAKDQYLWSSRFVMPSDMFIAMMRALRRLAMQMLTDMAQGGYQCPFGQFPNFVRRDFEVVDENPPRCVAMLLERAINYWLVGSGRRVLMIEPRVEPGEYGWKFNLTEDSFQQMYHEVEGRPSAPYLLDLPTAI